MYLCVDFICFCVERVVLERSTDLSPQLLSDGIELLDWKFFAFFFLLLRERKIDPFLEKTRWPNWRNVTFVMSLCKLSPIDNGQTDDSHTCKYLNTAAVLCKHWLPNVVRCFKWRKYSITALTTGRETRSHSMTLLYWINELV